MNEDVVIDTAASQDAPRPSRRGIAYDAPSVVVEQELKPLEIAARNNEIGIYTSLGDAANSGAVLVSTSITPPSSLAQLHAKRMPSRVLFVTRQEWEGVVTSITRDRFTARLTDLSGLPNAPQEEADFDVDLVSEDDSDLLQLGAVFRWSIGYQRMPGGTKQLTSQIVFRRLPRWTERDLNKADELADTFSAHFSAGNGDRNTAR